MSHFYILYSDFNCPFCYALHERLHDMDLLRCCEWRGAQHAPHLPRPMKPWQGSLGAELRQEVAVVQRLAPGLPIALPPGKPNTRAAIEQAVQWLRRDCSQGMEYVRQIYRALWREGRDISDPSVLTQLMTGHLAYKANEESCRIARDWETAWHETGQAGVPLIVSPAGDLLVGCVPVEEIRRFFV